LDALQTGTDSQSCCTRLHWPRLWPQLQAVRSTSLSHVRDDDDDDGGDGDVVVVAELN
jgi:hypothetical protein